MNTRSIKDSTWASATGFALLIVATMVAVMVFEIVRRGAPALSWSFLFGWPEEHTAGGLGAALFGTAALALVLLVLVSPVGILTGIWLAEFAPVGAIHTRILRASVQALAGIPSVVIGLFGLGFFVRRVGHSVGWGRPCLFWAALTLAVLTLPVVVTTTEQALLKVPRHLREASLALGVTHVQTVFGLVVPQALSGIVTGLVLATARASGEVVPLLLTGAVYFQVALPTRLDQGFAHLGTHTYLLATQPDVLGPRQAPLFASALVLLVLTLALHALALWLRNHMATRQFNKHLDKDTADKQG